MSSSYTNPSINQNNVLPIQLDAAIEQIRAAVGAISWVAKSFGRAWEFKEKDITGGKVLRIPKVYTQEGGYQNAMPNDSLFVSESSKGAMSFVSLVRGREDYESFAPHTGSVKRATLRVTVWGSLQVINPNKDYIFTEELKRDVERVLQGLSLVQSIVQWVDERSEAVFEGYDFTNEALLTEYLMYPYAGFHVDVEVQYDSASACNTEIPPNGFPSAGYLEGPYYNAAKGLQVNVPGDFVMYELQFNNIVTQDISHAPRIGIFNSNTMYIDWGNGTMRYPAETLIVNEYTAGVSSTIKVYHNNTPSSVVATTTDGLQNGTHLSSVSGSIPENIDTVSFADKLTDLPVLPSTIKNISLGNTSLSESALDGLIDELIANGLTGGRLITLTLPKSYLDQDKVAILVSRNWEVIDWTFAESQP